MGFWIAWAGLVLMSGHLLSAANTDNIDWSTENKQSYCELVTRRRFFKQLRLEIYCQQKVTEVDEQVGVTAFLLYVKPLKV